MPCVGRSCWDLLIVLGTQAAPDVRASTAGHSLSQTIRVSAASHSNSELTTPETSQRGASWSGCPCAHSAWGGEGFSSWSHWSPLLGPHAGLARQCLLERIDRMSVPLTGAPTGHVRCWLASLAVPAGLCARCPDDGSAIVREDERLGGLQRAWPGARAQHKCDPSLSPSSWHPEPCQEGTAPRTHLGPEVPRGSHGDISSAQAASASHCGSWSPRKLWSEPRLEGNLFASDAGGYFGGIGGPGAGTSPRSRALPHWG